MMTSCSTDAPLYQQTATALRLGLAASTLTTDAIRDACLARIAACEPTVGAWAVVDSEARPADADGEPRLLQGIPVGIKDIIAVEGLPMAYGTVYRREDRVATDASVVTLLRRAGAVILGKTVTSEMAYFTPGKTRNPWDLQRTPGGSSSGSAAAVAAGMVPLAVGTQTAGSILRPASYCGVVGFKPTHSSIPTAGIQGFSPSLDTVGCFARNVPDVALAYAAMTAGPALHWQTRPLSALRIGVAVVPSEGPLGPGGGAALERTLARLAEAGVQVQRIGPDPALEALPAQQSLVMAFEAARTLASVHARHARSMGLPLREIIEQGLLVSHDDAQAALRSFREQRLRVDTWFDDLDAIIAPAATGVAPAGLDSTGDPVYLRAWTALGLPCLSLPVEQGEQGLPVGLQLIGRGGDDAALLAVADALMNALCPNGIVHPPLA